MDGASRGQRGRMELAAEIWRAEFERALVELDRMTMQVIQTSLSLIGFGFTLYAFIANFADSARAPDLQGNARRLGMAFLLIGLILLMSGILQQNALRKRLWRRSRPDARASGYWDGIRDYITPSYLCAVLLLGAGLMALGSILLRLVILA